MKIEIDILLISQILHICYWICSITNNYLGANLTQYCTLHLCRVLLTAPYNYNLFLSMDMLALYVCMQGHYAPASLVDPRGSPPCADLTWDELLAARGGPESGHEIVLGQGGQCRGQVLAVLRESGERCVELLQHTYTHTYTHLINDTPYYIE